MPRNDQMTTCLERIRQGFKVGQVPVLSEDGTSGTYFLKDQNESIVSVFKPVDEEPFAPNNPRGMQAPFGSDTCRPGVKSGELTIREVVAYMLDHEGFADVPATTLVKASHSSWVSSPVSQNPAVSVCPLKLNQVLMTEPKFD